MLLCFCLILPSALIQAMNGWCSPPQSDGNSQEVLAVSGTQNKQKKGICELRAHKTKRPKKSQTHRQIV